MQIDLAMLKKSPKSRESRATRTRTHSTSSEDEVGRSQRGSQQPPAGRSRKHKGAPTRGRTLKRTISLASAGDEGDDGQGGDDDGSADDSESDADEPAVMAPSGLAQRKHNRQTGLSVSLANASIALSTGGKKRARTPMPEEDEGAAPPKKISKVMSTVTNLIDLSDEDDDIYNGVDLIESENEIDLERLEEQAIRVSEEGLFPVNDLHPRSALRSSVSLNGLADLDEQTPHFDEHFARTNGMGGIPDFSIPYPGEMPTHRLDLPNERRVRFVDDLKSDSGLSPGAGELEKHQSESDRDHPLRAHGSAPITEVEWRVYPPSDDASNREYASPFLLCRSNAMARSR